MPRRDRCILPGVPCHVTQRGVDRRETFSADADRETYLDLLRRDVEDAGVGLLAWCLMTNHVHLVAMPEREDSLAVLLRRVHGRYAQYYNARHGRSGHLWQNRYFACSLGPGHLETCLAYVEMNPVRAGMVERPGEYRWSSAAAHLGRGDASGLVDMEWWQREYDGVDWGQVLGAPEPEQAGSLRRCTYAGRPFGDEEFVKAIAEQFGRHWVRRRPRKERAAAPAENPTSQLALFAERTWNGKIAQFRPTRFPRPVFPTVLRLGGRSLSRPRIIPAARVLSKTTYAPTETFTLFIPSKRRAA